MQAGDKVSVYADVRKACLKGQTQPFTGTKLYLGNGVALLSRKQLYVDKPPPWYVTCFIVAALELWNSWLLNNTIYGSKPAHALIKVHLGKKLFKSVVLNVHL